MICLTVEVPDIFAAAINQGNVTAVCDAPATSAHAYFGRGIARTIAGRDQQAREDFIVAVKDLGDACRIELALLDLRSRAATDATATELRAIAERAQPGSALAARAWHVLGRAEDRRRDPNSAVDALQRAAASYRSRGERLGIAHVYDTLGAVEAGRGRHDIAAQLFALSLVEKALIGDLNGMAVTLGHLGRANLYCDRAKDAIECLERGLEIAQRVGDRRNIARMHHDLGRAALQHGDTSASEKHLQEGLAIARQEKYTDLEFFMLKDLSRLYIARGGLAEAKVTLQMAENAIPSASETYLRNVLDECRGELLLALQKSDEAIELLNNAVLGYEEAGLPDMEIPARIKLAAAYAEQRRLLLAGQCLQRGLNLARSEGLARHGRELRQAMLRIGADDVLSHETGRRLDDSNSAISNSYVKLERLGSGAFGEVFRVFDSWRGDVVALKILNLNAIDDDQQRQRMIASARAEIEAASRVRHPGVVRIHAIGEFADGQVYIVQDLVDGQPLLRRMPMDASADLKMVLSYIAKIADALQALHNAGVVHRDVKPSNVVDCAGWPVLIDFGIAHVPAIAHISASKSQGTMGYMAPEQARGARVDGRADVYALGVLAYQWLTGQFPLQLYGKCAAELIHDLQTRKPTPLSHYRPDIDPAVDKFIMSMLAKRPCRRPSNALDVATQMRRLPRP